MGDILAMSEKERERLVVLQQVASKRLLQGEAAERLGLSVRHIKRLGRALRECGDAALVSKRRGRPSSNRLSCEVRSEIEGHLRGRYAGFGATLAAEKLLEIEKISVSRETVRQLQIALGVWRPKVKREGRVFQTRERRPRFGELIQIDGSPHDWFCGRAPKCTLIVFIDDATGRLTSLHFAPAETIHAYSAALKQHILAHGVPLALYSDRHGIFRVNAKEAVSGDGKTTFNRFTERLKIAQICALTPQAKGRVERANQTLQDRLVKELTLHNISTLEAANAFLPQFIAAWNKRFVGAPKDPNDAHRAWTETAESLEQIFTERETRCLSGSLSFSYHGTVYGIIPKDSGRTLRGAKVTIYAYGDGRLEVRYKDRILPHRLLETRPRPIASHDAKTLDAHLDALILSRQPEKPAKQPSRREIRGAALELCVAPLRPPYPPAPPTKGDSLTLQNRGTF